MTEYELRVFLCEEERWRDGTPDDFDPFNSWGGHHTARATVKANADNARRELQRRSLA